MVRYIIYVNVEIYIKVDVRNYPEFQNHLLLFENDLLHVLNVYEVQTNYLSDCRVIQTINNHEVGNRNDRVEMLTIK